MDVRDGTGVGALEIISQHQILTRIHVLPTGHARVLNKFDAVGFGTTWRGWVRSGVDFEGEVQGKIVRAISWPPIGGNRCGAGPRRVSADVKLLDLCALPAELHGGPLQRLGINSQPISFGLRCCASLDGWIGGVKTIIIHLRIVAHNCGWPRIHEIPDSHPDL